MKAAGSAIAATALETSVGGATTTDEEKRQQEQEKYERLCEKHRESGNVEQFHRILERQCFNVVQARSYTYDVPGDDHRNEPSKRGAGDVTTMEGYPKSDLEVTASIFEGRYSSFSDMDWGVNSGWWTNGEDPEDNLTLGWSDNHYVYDG